MSNSQPFNCPFCSQSFTRSENLERHKRTRHGTSGSKNFECPLCHTVFSRRDICKRHQERCDGNPSSRRARRTQSRVAARSITVETPKSSPSRASPHVSEPLLAMSQASDPTQSASQVSDEITAPCVAAYFANFHPIFPVIHRPTFSLVSTPRPLLNVVIAIGNLYRCRTDPSIDIDTAHWQSNDLWEGSVADMQRTAISDPGRWKENWILQTSLLCVVYGAFAAERFAKSRQMLSSLVNDIREAGLLHQHMYGYYFAPWRQELNSEMSLGPGDLEETWRSFIDEESLKLSLYGIVMIDLQLVLACNTRPEMSPLEVVWDLPWSTRSWEANTAEEWWQHIVQEASSYHCIEGPMSDRGPTLKSLFIATQSLLTDGPPETLLRALSSSHFALLCITANIYRLVRGFTHNLYQLPPNPANPSPFHILTHAQNSQISTAVKTILGLKSAGLTIAIENNLYGELWDAVELLCWVIKVSLCIPDDFLICGIVDTDITAAFATAAHLSLGNQVLGRRSRNIITTPRAFNDEGFLLIFEELMNAMNGIWGADAQKAMREAPWITVAGFRVLLDLYRVLRLAMTDIQERTELGIVTVAKSFDPAQVIYTAVKDALTMHIRNKRALLATRNLAELGLLELTEDPKVCERKFMMLMIQSCNERNVWAVGRAMAMVLEEISTGHHA